MVIIEPNIWSESYLAYDAPVNEKTQQLRDKFKMDESGYPEHYKWRGLSRLGSSYKPWEPFEKFDPYEEREYYSTKLFYLSLTGLLSAGGHWYVNYTARRRMWSRPWIFLTFWGSFGGGMIYWLEKSLEREGIKQKIYAQYMKKFYDRFGPVNRYKYRECLFNYTPVR